MGRGTDTGNSPCSFSPVPLPYQINTNPIRNMKRYRLAGMCQGSTYVIKRVHVHASGLITSSYRVKWVLPRTAQPIIRVLGNNISLGYIRYSLFSCLQTHVTNVGANALATWNKDNTNKNMKWWHEKGTTNKRTKYYKSQLQLFLCRPKPANRKNRLT